MPAVDAETGKADPGGEETPWPWLPTATAACSPRSRRAAPCSMRATGTSTLFSYGQIDNPLVQLCHPELIGYHLLADSEMTTQVIRKQDPLEKVGNVVMVDGKMQIIEYSDLPRRSRRSGATPTARCASGPAASPSTYSARRSWSRCRSEPMPCRSTWPARRSRSSMHAVSSRRRINRTRSSSNDSFSTCCPGPGMPIVVEGAHGGSLRAGQERRRAPRPIRRPPRATR